jgi:predicted RNA-binding protein with PIN domain
VTAVTFLIDGYNLMHAVGLLRTGLPRGRLERARIRFLDWLADAVKGRADTLRVVFDAQDAPSASREIDHRGVRVRFAFRKTADDEIEELLAAETRPTGLVVVSNDGRVREAGRRRKATTLSCEEFVDWTLDRPRPLTASLETPEREKPEPRPTVDEMTKWLDAFSTPPKRRKR